MDQGSPDKTPEPMQSALSWILQEARLWTEEVLPPDIFGLPTLYVIAAVACGAIATVVALAVASHKRKVQRQNALKKILSDDDHETRPLFIDPASKRRSEPLVITEDEDEKPKPLFPTENLQDASPDAELQDLFSEIKHYQKEHQEETALSNEQAPGDAKLLDNIEKEFKTLENEVNDLSHEAPSRKPFMVSEPAAETKQAPVEPPVNRELGTADISYFGESSPAPAAEGELTIEQVLQEIEAASSAPAEEPLPDLLEHEKSAANLQTELQQSISELSEKLTQPAPAPEPQEPMFTLSLDDEVPVPAPAIEPPATKPVAVPETSSVAAEKVETEKNEAEKIEFAKTEVVTVTAKKIAEESAPPAPSPAPGVNDEFIARMKKFQDNIEKRFGAAQAEKPVRSPASPAAPATRVRLEKPITMETLESLIFTANQNKKPVP